MVQDDNGQEYVYDSEDDVKKDTANNSELRMPVVFNTLAPRVQIQRAGLTS